MTVDKAIIVLVIMALIITWILLIPVIAEKRRSKLINKPFPLPWRKVIEEKVAIYNYLPPLLQKRLRGHIQVFLSEKQFIGCQGLQVTDEMKVTIAAIACILLLNERGKYYPQLRSILVYPGTYWASKTTPRGNFVIEESRVTRLGESWTNGQVVLSWEQIQRDTVNWNDGHNVVLHEFAHQLDQEGGEANGVPILARKSDYLTWASVMRQEYQQLCSAIEQGVNTVMDAYGATEPAEFFAVATETFFEKPQLMLRRHSDLYQLLQRYYQLDPVQWR